MRIGLVIFLCILLPFFAFACTSAEVEPESDESTIKTVTTIYPLADITGQLGGEKVSVTHLLPAGASPHTYEPTVEQARLIDEASLFIYVGSGLDDWAVKLAEAAGQELVMINLSEHVDLYEPTSYRRLEEKDNSEDVHDREERDSNHDHSKNDHDHDNNRGHNGHSHDHGPADPHFWLDPVLVRDAVCPAISEQLISLVPAEEEYFKEMLEQYRGELTFLHEEIDEAAAAFSHSRFVAFHSAWQYFGRRYDLQEVAVIAEFPGQEPSAGWIAELVKLIEKENIGAIFAEPQFSPALAERVAEESGSEVLVIDPLGGEDVSGRKSYLELMHYNLEVFKEAME